MDKADNVVAPLGNYITLVTRKNKNLEVTKLVGVTVEKEVIASVSLGEKINMKACFIIENGEFVVRLMNIEMTGRLAIGLYKANERATVSSRYRVFKVTNSFLNKHYLMFIFKKKTTELELLYRCFGGIRGELGWKDFVKLPISVPPLNKQKRIVNKYQTITRYVELKKRINELFEKQMTAYYHALFDNLTDFTIKDFGEILSIIRGGRPPRGNQEQESKYFCKEGGIPWLQVRDIAKKGLKFVDKATEQLTPEGFKRANCYMISPRDLIFVHNSNEFQLGKIYINSSDMTINTNFWGISNNLVRGGASR